MTKGGRLGEVARYFLWLGVVGFGGPNAHIAAMRSELVERRRWVDDRRFLDVMGVTNLIPGPNSSEVAIHLGYLRAGVPGGLAAGLAFMAPAFAIVVALAWAYTAYGPTPARDDLLAGVQPVAVAAIVVALWKLRRGAAGGWLTPALAAAGFALTLAFPRYAPLAILGGGVVGLAARPRRDAPSSAAVFVPLLAAGGLVLAANLSGLPALGWVFLRTGLLLFGGGLVLVPLLEPEVLARGWTSRREFLDGIAIGQSTPGPIVMTAAFVGYVVAGLAGAAVATAAIYLPSFVAVLAVAGPFLRRFREQPDVAAFVRAVSATALGSVLASAVILGRAGITSPFRVAAFVAGGVALLARVPVVWVILAAAVAGLGAGALGWT